MSVVNDEATYSSAANVRQVAEAIPNTIEECPEFWQRLEAEPRTLQDSAEALEAVVGAAGLLAARGVLEPTEELCRELRAAFDKHKGDLRREKMLRAARWLLLELSGGDQTWREACVATVRDTVLAMRAPLKRSEVIEATSALAAAGVPVEGDIRDTILDAYTEVAADMPTTVHRVVLGDLAKGDAALPRDAAARIAGGVSEAVLNGPNTAPRTASSLLTSAARLRLPLSDQCKDMLYRRAISDTKVWKDPRTTIQLLRKLGIVGMRTGGQLPVHVQQGMRSFIPRVSASEIVTLVVAFAPLNLRVHGKTRDAIAARMVEAIPEITDKSLQMAIAGMGQLALPVEGDLRDALLERIRETLPRLDDDGVVQLATMCGRADLVLSEDVRTALRERLLAAMPDVGLKRVGPLANSVHRVFSDDRDVAAALAAAVARHAPELGIYQLLQAVRGLNRVERGSVDDACREVVSARAAEVLPEGSATLVATLASELGRLEVPESDTLRESVVAQLQRVCPRIANLKAGSGELCAELTWGLAKLGVQLGEEDKLVLREAMGRATSVGPESEERLRWAVGELDIPV